MMEQGEKSSDFESIDLPDTFTTKFMKMFPPIMFGIILLGITITGVVYGPEKIIEVVSMIIGSEPTFRELTQCTLLVAAANILCLPSSMLEFVIAYQLGAWGLLPNVLGDFLGCVVTYFIGRCLALPDPDPSNVTMTAVNSTIQKRPYLFAMLMRVAPLPSGFKNYGSGAIKLPAGPYIICTSFVAPFFSAVMTLVALSARGIMDELEHLDDDGNVIPTEVAPGDMPLWVKLSLLILVGGATFGLTTYTLRTVQNEIQLALKDASDEYDQDDEVDSYMPPGDITPTHGQRIELHPLTPQAVLPGAGAVVVQHHDANLISSVQRLAHDQLPPLKFLDDAYLRVSLANHILTPKGRVLSSNSLSHSASVTVPLSHGDQQQQLPRANISTTFHHITHHRSPRTSPNPRSLTSGNSPHGGCLQAEVAPRSHSFGTFTHSSGNAFGVGFKPLSQYGEEHL